MTKSVPAALVLIGLVLVILLVGFCDRPSTRQAGNEAKIDQAQIVHGKAPQTSATNSKRKASRAGSRDGVSPAGETVPGSMEPAKNANRLAPDYSDDEQNEELVIGGMVIDEDGNPMSGIEVLARRIDPEEGPSPSFDQMDEGVLSIFSDFGGTFLFSNLEDGTYQLRVAPAEGVASALMTVRVGLLNVKLVVLLQWEVRVYGTVSSTAGDLLQNVQVTAGRQTLATRTGSQGEYELDVSLQGFNRTHVVYFRRDGYRDQKMAIDTGEMGYWTAELRLDVTMESLAALTTVVGSLTDTEGRAVSGKILTMASSRLHNSYQTQSDIKGKFTFKEVEPGKDYRLQIRPGSGYKDKDINSLEVPGRGLNLDIVLDLMEQGELTGWMVDLDGKPIPGFAMNLRSSIASRQLVRVVGDQQGFFSVQDFPVGDAVLRTSSYPVFSVQGIRVSPLPEEPITIFLDTGPHVLEGRVIDSFGKPVAADSVILGWTHNDAGVQSSSSRKTTADQTGYFVFTGLGPGLHRMWVAAPGFRTAVVKIDIGISRDDIIVELEEEP